MTVGLMISDEEMAGWEDVRRDVELWPGGARARAGPLEDLKGRRGRPSVEDADAATPRGGRTKRAGVRLASALLGRYRASSCKDEPVSKLAAMPRRYQPAAER
jgi:hypothetical protein